MRRMPRVLIVGDHARSQVWRIVFAGRGWEVVLASTEDEGLARLDPAPDYVILDGASHAILHRIREAGPKTRVAFITDPATVPAGATPEVTFPRPGDVAEIWREGLRALVH